MAKGTIQLTTKNLILRPFKEEDILSSHHNWLSRDEVFVSMDSNPSKSLEESITYVKSKFPYYASRYFYDWCLIEKDTNECIGEINGVRTKDKKGISIGYCLSPDDWGKGYMKEALLSILSYFFESGYQYIEAECREENISSIYLLKSLNFENRTETIYRLNKNY